MDKITLRNAKKTDLSAIVEIADSKLLTSDMPERTAEQHGFLVSGYSLKEYEKYLDIGAYLFVAEQTNKIIGFLLAFEPENFQSDEVVNNLIKYNLTESFVLIKQICVADDYEGKNIAKRLYNYLFELKQNTGFAAAIVTDPFNLRSILFHEKLGFQRLFDVLPPADRDGQIRPRGIWYRPSSESESRSALTRLSLTDYESTKTIMMDNLNNAVTLYTHEDNLNWTKFGMHITFLMVLFAVFPYLWDHTSGFLSLVMSCAVILFGNFINYLFMTKLKSGLHFMSSHKQKVLEIEHKLKQIEPSYTPLIYVKDTHISGKSKTVYWLQRIPAIISFVWVICSVLLLIRQIKY